MKKILLIITIVLILTSCKTNEYVGKYTLSSIEINNNVYVEGDEEWETILGMNISGENIYIELENNGQMFYVVTNQIKEGTWQKDNSLITMSIDGYEEKATYQDDMLVLVNSDNAKLIFEK